MIKTLSLHIELCTFIIKIYGAVKIGVVVICLLKTILITIMMTMMMKICILYDRKSSEDRLISEKEHAKIWVHIPYASARNNLWSWFLLENVIGFCNFLNQALIHPNLYFKKKLDLVQYSSRVWLDAFLVLCSCMYFLVSHIVTDKVFW